MILGHIQAVLVSALAVADAATTSPTKGAITTEKVDDYTTVKPTIIPFRTRITTFLVDAEAGNIPTPNAKFVVIEPDSSAASNLTETASNVTESTTSEASNVTATTSAPASAATNATASNGTVQTSHRAGNTTTPSQPPPINAGSSLSSGAFVLALCGAMAVLL